MRLAFLALAMACPAMSSAVPATPPEAPPAAAQNRLAAGAATPSRICRDDLRVRPVESPRSSKPRRLGELPPGDLTLTVVNRVGDCIEPVIVREGLGFGGR